MPSGPGFFFTFLYYFSCTSLIVIFVTWQGLGVNLDTALPYQFGSLLGLLAGLWGAYFNRSLSLNTTFSNQKAFLKNLNENLNSLGFQEQEKREELTIYSKSGLSNWFAGQILLQIDEKSATIIGRSSYIRRLRHRL
jgi:uncharacterized membrane protein YraQ (UPF0718 family)